MEFIGLIKMPNFGFDKFPVAKCELSNSFSDFLKAILSILANCLYLQTYFWGGYMAWLHEHLPKEVGLDTGVVNSSTI